MYLKSFNYAGSKYRILDDILKEFPNDIKNYIYVESFLGSGAVFLNVSSDFKFYIINDKQYDIYCFWKAIFEDINKVSNLINKYNKNFKIKQNYILFRDEYNKIIEFNDIFEIASRFYILSNTCLNSLHRWNKIGKFNQSWGNRNCHNNLLDLKNKIESIKNKTLILNVDFKILFEKLLYSKQKFLLYCDPPYFITNIYSRTHKWGIEEEQIMFKYLENFNYFKYKFILSNLISNNASNSNIENEILKNELLKYKKIDINIRYNSSPCRRKTNNKIQQEVLIKNF
jgi:DNA adenine methylase Dam